MAIGLHHPGTRHVAEVQILPQSLDAGLLGQLVQHLVECEKGRFPTSSQARVDRLTIPIEDEFGSNSPGVTWPTRNTSPCSSRGWRSGTSGGRRTLISSRTCERRA